VPLTKPSLKLPKFVPDASAFISSCGEGDRRVFAVVSTRVAMLFPGLARSLERAGVKVIAWGDGERCKTAASKERLESALVRSGADRMSLIAAIGGGTLLDLCGFTAATLFRGVGWIAVPTTLLAMVDASMGGKTGINTRLGKNLVGAFHYPEKTAVWLPFLETLPAREKKNGLAECVKHGLIADECHYLQSLNADLEDPGSVRRLVADSQKIKMNIVRMDPFDRTGERNLLNFGHTVGHAVESASGYRLRHGEAVLLGMAMECAASFVDGHCDQLAFLQVKRDLLESARAAVLKGFSPGDIWRFAARDKKRRGGTPWYIPLKGAGSPAFPPPHLAPLSFNTFRKSFKLVTG